jgi:hypothetical protein
MPARQSWGQTSGHQCRLHQVCFSALRSAVILANSFPRESEVQLRALIRRYIADVATQEWPMMARRSVTLTAIPSVLAEAHDRPFTGEISIKPDALLQVMPE